MAKQEYFKSALSDFTYEAASGGAIRHLADLGYSVKQICEQLSFPTPYERVQKTVWQHLVDTGVILMEEPGSGQSWRQRKPEYVMEQDKYGRRSFRMAAPRDEGAKQISWKERNFCRSSFQCSGFTVSIGEDAEDVRAVNVGKKASGIRAMDVKKQATDLCTADSRKLAAYLHGKCVDNEGEAYLSCSIGLMLRHSPQEYEALLQVLQERQREYLSGLPWEAKLCYHKLDGRMQEIAVRLYAAGQLRECCYFMKTEEKVTFT